MVKSQQGMFNGIGVRISESVANMQEEASFAVSKMKSGDFVADKIKKSKSEESEQKSRIERLLAAELTVTKIEEVNTLVKDLAKGEGSEAVLVRFLQKYSADINEQYFALIEARRQLLKREGNFIATALKLVNLKISQLERTREISENKNTAQVGVVDLRRVYQSAVVNFSTLSSVWQKLISVYGAHRWKKAKRYLLRTLAEEYEAEGSDIDCVQLTGLMRDMSWIKLLSAVYDSCEETTYILRSN